MVITKHAESIFIGTDFERMIKNAGIATFKLDLKDRCIMLLVYYRLYITHKL